MKHKNVLVSFFMIVFTAQSVVVSPAVNKQYAADLYKKIDTKKLLDAVNTLSQNKNVRLGASVVVGGVTLYLLYKNYTLNQENVSLKDRQKRQDIFIGDIAGLLSKNKFLDEKELKDIKSIKDQKFKDTQLAKKLYASLDHMVRKLDETAEELEIVKTASQQSGSSESDDDSEKTESILKAWYNPARYWPW